MSEKPHNKYEVTIMNYILRDGKYIPNCATIRLEINEKDIQKVEDYLNSVGTELPKDLW